ncbi:hypothetical protein [Planococcus lenghuensis]|uniref:Uncharacterized protein n=1 Tax=Planococcus lenghuensis TaxID=2213202 RepID=A0A1Q2KWQ2_9BACL|nr:hypothetical protein [Planococcus lenghuensis]AQQ52620.1 hypothetical protein B0X71_05585 [Planococcus lenghuensis]
MEGLVPLVPLITMFLFTLLPLALLVAVIVYVVRLVRRTERRAEERLQLDKENADIQLQQTQMISELNERLTGIEKVLREVE